MMNINIKKYTIKDKLHNKFNSIISVGNIPLTREKKIKW